MRNIVSFVLLFSFVLIVPHAGDKNKTLPTNFISSVDDNGDASKTISEFVTEQGYEFEEHKVETKDGYILTVWRLYKKNLLRKQPPVILQHGVLENGFSFFVQGPQKNLPMFLVKRQYDVWVANNRGQTYSLEHRDKLSWLNPFSKYWNFTFHEMGIYDFPAIVDYIKKKTGFKKVSFIGQSQGSTQFFVKGTLDPDYINNNIAAFIGTSPAVYINSATTSFVDMIQKIRIFDFLYAIGINSFWAIPPKGLSLFEAFCRRTPFLYDAIVPRISGKSPRSHFDYKRWPSFCSHLPGGSSNKNLVHWMQLMRSEGKFQMFDYGAEKNNEVYKQSIPPEYPLERFKEIHVPKLFFAGTRDSLVSRDKIERLRGRICMDGEECEIIEMENYAHTDYYWSTKSVYELYPRMERFLRKNIHLD